MGGERVLQVLLFSSVHFSGFGLQGFPLAGGGCARVLVSAGTELIFPL